MKIPIFVSILILIVAFLLYFIPVIISPTGTDVQNSINLRNEVELMIKNSGYTVGGESNIVMMKPKKGDLVVVIKNAQPSIESIYTVVNQNVHLFETKSLTIIFKDRQMNQVEVRQINRRSK